MIKSTPPHEHFFGSTTLGEKGQVVVPAATRTALKLKKGDRLLVFAMGNGMIVLAKLEHLAKFEEHMAQRLKSIRKAVKSAQ